MAYQPHRGNPEAKQYFLINNFVGGINTLSADDLISTIEAREVLNMNVSGSGMINKREGFGYATVMNNLLANALPTGFNYSDILFVKVIKSEGNITKYIEEFDSWEEFLSFIRYRPYKLNILIGYVTNEDPDEFDRVNVKVDLIRLANNEGDDTLSGGFFDTLTFDSIYNEDNIDYFLSTAGETLEGGLFQVVSEIENMATFNNVLVDGNKVTNIDLVSYLGKEFILLPQISRELDGLLQIDEVENNVYETTIIDDTNPDALYKPNPIDLDAEVSPLGGYNMLYSTPIEHVANHTSLRSLRGIYLTSPSTGKGYEDIGIPVDGSFRVNVLFTGSGITTESFNLEFFTEDQLGNKTSIGYTLVSSEIDDAIATFRVELDPGHIIEGDFVTVRVELVKEEEPITPLKQFSDVSVMEAYFTGKNYILTSGLDFNNRVDGDEVIEDQIHNLYVRTTNYDYERKNLAVYRKDTTRLFGFSDISLPIHYILNDDNEVYEISGRTVVNEDQTSFDAATYQDVLDILVFDPVVSVYDTASAYISDRKDKYRENTYIEANVKYWDDGIGTYILQGTAYFSILTSDNPIGTISYSNSYYNDENSTAGGVLRTSTINDVKPVEGIYLIDNRDTELDEPLYYTYDSTNVTGTFSGDFEFFNYQADTFIEDNVEYPVKGDLKTQDVLGIDLEYARMVEIEGRLVAFKGNTIWFSDYRRFNYFPSNTYFNLSIASDDEIVAIKYFRGSHIVFTRKTIWKMKGNIDVGDISFEVLNDSIGAIAPDSIQPFNNTLVFMTRDGLYRIKQNFYLDGLENVEKIDKRIMGLVQPDIDYESVLYNEQYFLFLRGNEDYDTMRYYYNVGLGRGESPFVLDKYAKYPDHIMKVGGSLYAIKDGWFWKYGEGYTDFLPETHTEEDITASTYLTRIQFPNFSFGYPTHEKKFKHIFLKTITGKEMPLYLTIKIDGYEYASPSNFRVYRTADGIIQYDFTLDIQTSELGSFILGEHELGGSDVNQHRVAVGGKGKNLTLIVEQESDDYFGITNVGFLFKLGKVRGDR